MRRLSLFLAAVLCAPALAGAITAGQVDDFENGTLQGWTSGASNPNGPVNEDGQGPGGAGDRALVATGNGSTGAGGKLVILNQAQWTGDYLAAGVNALRVDLRNLSDVGLTIRAVLRGSGGSFATSYGAELDADDDGFVSVAFSLEPEDLTFVEGSNDVMATLGNVTEVRLLHTTAPDLRGDPVDAQLAVDNVTALACASGLAAKADSPADYLLLPAFEVDTMAAGGLTTFFAVHNQTDKPQTALVRYLNRAGSLERSDELALAARQTRTVNVGGVEGLEVDADGFARGSVEVRSCSAEEGEEPATSLTGDYIYLDNNGNFATGDQLLRREDVCAKLQVRLLNFGSGIRLRLFVSDPQGPVDPTATFAVYNEAGAVLDSGDLVTADSVLVLDSTELTSIRFGTLDLEFVAGGGALSVEYSAFGRFSVAMNANCVEP